MSCLYRCLCDADAIQACSRSPAIEYIAGERGLHLLVVNFTRAKPIADAALETLHGGSPEACALINYRLPDETTLLPDRRNMPAPRTG